MGVNDEARIKELEKEIIFLKIELQNATLRANAMTQNLKDYEVDIKKAIEANQNAILDEQKWKTTAESWEKVVDEIAHSINSDIYAAIVSLNKFLDLPKIKKANDHICQIRDITNLLIDYLKRDNIKYSGEFSVLNIKDIVNAQLHLIKEAISTLKISSDVHEEALQTLYVPVHSTGDCSVEIIEEFADAIPLLIKDLVRNAIKHTSENNPKVDVSIIENSSFVELRMQNNGVISAQIADWFNNDFSEEPLDMSKSSKVGLRVVKKWVNLLKIDTKYFSDIPGDSTTVILKFPKKINYEKDKSTRS